MFQFQLVKMLGWSCLYSSLIYSSLIYVFLFVCPRCPESPVPVQLGYRYSSSSFCFEHPRWIGNLRFLDSQDTVGLEGEITIPLIRGSQLTSGGQDSGFIRFSEEIRLRYPKPGNLQLKHTFQNGPGPKQTKKTMVFQPSICRCDLLVLGRVAVEWYWKYS